MSFTEHLEQFVAETYQLARERDRLKRQLSEEDGAAWRVMVHTGGNTWTPWPDTYPTSHTAWAVAYALAMADDRGTYVERVDQATAQPHTEWIQHTRWDLTLTYIDRCGNPWTWAGRHDENGTPIMNGNGGENRLTDAEHLYGPLTTEDPEDDGDGPPIFTPMDGYTQSVIEKYGK